MIGFGGIEAAFVLGFKVRSRVATSCTRLVCPAHNSPSALDLAVRRRWRILSSPLRPVDGHSLCHRTRSRGTQTLPRHLPRMYRPRDQLGFRAPGRHGRSHVAACYRWVVALSRSESDRSTDPRSDSPTRPDRPGRRGHLCDRARPLDWDHNRRRGLQPASCHRKAQSRSTGRPGTPACLA
jgi:hypothetical protein